MPKACPYRSICKNKAEPYYLRLELRFSLYLWDYLSVTRLFCRGCCGSASRCCSRLGCGSLLCRCIYRCGSCLCGGGSRCLDARDIDRSLGGERSADRYHADKDGETPCRLLDEVGGLAITKILVTLRIVGSEASSFRFLNEHDSDKQETCYNNKNAEKNIHCWF